MTPPTATTTVVSEEFWISERKRSSLSRVDNSASSFRSMVAPARRITNRRMNPLMMANEFASNFDSFDGAQPCQMKIWPTVRPMMVHVAEVGHTLDPPWDTFSNAMNANAMQSAGPHPVREITNVT